MKIFIATRNKYPEPSALTTRITLVAKLLTKCGHEVKIFGRGETAEGVYENLPFVSLRGECKKRPSLLFHYLFSFSRHFLQAVKDEKPDVVLFYSLPPGLVEKLIKKQKNGKIRLINDCLEWYSKEEFNPLKPEIYEYYSRERMMKKLLPGSVEIIAISKFLQEYFQSKGNPCVYLPSICDTSAVTCDKKPNPDRITVVYAGSPVKKDSFEPIVKAINALSDEQKGKLELHIVGSTASAIAANANVSEEYILSLGDCIRFIPRMSHAEVLEYLNKADFTILIRPAEMRYAKAGFPTKVPESLSTGTPVICNFSSDLSSFLQDGVDSIIATDNSTEAVKCALERALSLSVEQRHEMFQNARKTAEERFDYKNYVVSLKKLLG